MHDVGSLAHAELRSVHTQPSLIPLVFVFFFLSFFIGGKKKKTRTEIHFFAKEVNDCYFRLLIPPLAPSPMSGVPDAALGPEDPAAEGTVTSSAIMPSCEGMRPCSLAHVRSARSSSAALV